MPSSNAVDEALRGALREASKLPQLSLEGEVLVTYTGKAKPAASSLYIALLHSGVKAWLAHSALASVHILPYREVGRVVAFTLDERDARTVNLAMASHILGVPVHVVGPRLHEAVEETLGDLGVERVVVENDSPLFVMMAAALYWRPKLMGAREERVRGEVAVIEESIGWVRERFRVEAEAVSRRDYEAVLYTPSMEAGALYAGQLAGVPVEPLDDLAGRGLLKAVAFVAGVDEHNYRDILLGASLRGARLARILIDTDPVTVNIYASILSSIALSRVI